MSRFCSVVIIALMLAIGLLVPAQSAVYKWNVGSGLWTQPSNWDLNIGLYPGEGDDVYIDNKGTCTLNSATETKALYVRVGQTAAQTGTLILDNTTLYLYSLAANAQLMVGTYGTGYVYQYGGTVRLGGDEVNARTYNLALGNNGTGAGERQGYYYMRGGEIARYPETGGPATSYYNVYIGNSQGAGFFNGYGTINSGIRFFNNGMVTAQSDTAEDKTLQINASIFSGRENAYATYNWRLGWYAINHGKLTLPPVSVAEGASVWVNWGETTNDASVDLNNSARLDFTNVSAAGTFTGSLLALDHSSVPELPENYEAISVLELVPDSSLQFESMNLTVKYDRQDRAGASMALLKHDGSAWVEVTSSVDTGNQKITANNVTMGKFLVAMPIKHWNVASGSYNVNSNWDDGVRPSDSTGGGHVAVVDNGGTCNLVTYTPDAGCKENLMYRFTLGSQEGTTGSAVLSAGATMEVLANNGMFVVGDEGTGTFTNYGTVRLNGAAATTFYPAARAIMIIGNFGTGTCVMKGGTFLRGGGYFPMIYNGLSSEGKATIKGYGSVSGGGLYFYNNGAVIGESDDGTDKLLDLSGAFYIASSLENRGSDGWFAKNRGAVKMLSVGIGTGAVNWGEMPADTDIDLINSAKFNFTGASSTDKVTGTLLATDRSDIASLPGGGAGVIGVWDFSTASAFISTNVTFRYDDLKAGALSIPASNLRIYQLQGGLWIDVTASVDAAKKQITSTELTSLGRFAIAGEPVVYAAASLKNAKQAANGTRVAVTATVSAAFDGFFYIEDAERISGIRVVKANHGLSAGTDVEVKGAMETLSSGERCINADYAPDLGTTRSIAPLGLTNKALGGGDNGAQIGVSYGTGLNNIGLLIKTTGRVSNATGTSFVLDDGSGVPVTAALATGALPAEGSYISVIGASSCAKEGTAVKAHIEAVSVQTEQAP